LFSYYGYDSALYIEPNKLFEAEEVTIADDEAKQEVDNTSLNNPIS
jgi:hypothetical protein